MIWVLVVLPIVLLLLGFPIFTILLLASIAMVTLIMDIAPAVLHNQMFNAVGSQPLFAVPFFIFAGAIMSQGGISRRLVDWILSLIGPARGSMALTTVGTCTVFGAISGSSPATVAAVGGMMYPSLREKGYDEKFSSGLIASSGAIASIIPPSIAMILYAASSEQSVTELFSAGILPGILIAALMAGYIYIYARRKGIREHGSFNLGRIAKTTVAGLPALGTPAIILGGIYGGIVTPLESAGVACIWGALVAVFIYRELTWKELWQVSVESVYLTAQVLIIVAASGVFSYLLTINQIPQSLASLLQSLDASQFQVLLLINIFLLVVGCLLDPASAILVLTPLLVPIAQAAQIDLVHLGIIMTVNLSIGMFTPPFGLNIFVTQALFKVPLSKLYPGLVPFIIVNLIGLAVITYWSDLSLFLVPLLGR
jgi:C4-dicarboxylate transporter DctM subunit